jgi:hypothetical protein
VTISQQIKDNWGWLSILLGALVGVAGWGAKVFVEDYVDSAIAAKMVAIGQVSADRVSAIEKDVEEVRRQHATDAGRIDDKVERIVQILLED